ncbi:MAG TPA: 2-phosphosulfolactate phosphatase [Candidatus Nitrosotalea sp.]|nr:2-phosphosulfolactate phosphatase [Candidatus Nitrosotalea sp.]
MRIRIVDGVLGARRARGTVVVIDVLRAFSVSAYALAGGATECRLVREVDEALRLARRLEGALVSAEVNGLPVPGIPISNSPTQVSAADLNGRVLIQRSSAGTQCTAAAGGADQLFAASLVVARATARAVRAQSPALVTLVASGIRGRDLEDRACAAYIQGLLEGRDEDPRALLAPLRASERYLRLAAGEVLGFAPSDLELSLEPNRFDFALLAGQDAEGQFLRRLP